MMKKQKIKAMVIKYQKTRRGISQSSKKKSNYKSDTKDKIDLNQANNKYILPN